MNWDHHKENPADRRRRYVVHLSCLPQKDVKICQYVVRIRPSAGRGGARTQVGERVFEDDRELIAAINPVLPPTSDVRDVFEHIESQNGFFYLLWLTDEEAQRLGWEASLPH